MPTDLFQAVRRDGASAVTALANTHDINLKNDDEQNFLHVAIVYGNQSVIGHLLISGIDVNSPDSKGQTPLHYAAAYQNADAAEQIFSSGGDIALLDTHGNTALWTAVFNARGKYRVVEVFLQHGGRQLAGVRNNHGKSPLDFARQIGDKTLLTMLEG